MRKKISARGLTGYVREELEREFRLLKETRSRIRIWLDDQPQLSAADSPGGGLPVEMRGGSR
jgi:hypothetical protein